MNPTRFPCVAAATPAVDAGTGRQRARVTVALMTNYRAFLRVGVTAVALFLSGVPRLAFAQPVVGVLGIAAEVAPIEAKLQDDREVVVRGYVFRVGTLNGRQVVVGRSGVGKVNAAIVATLLIDHFTPAALVFSGTAGAVDPTLRPGDVVIGATTAQHDVGRQLPDGIRRRGVRNAVTGEMDPLLVPAPEPLLTAATRAMREVRLPPVKTPEGERAPRIVEGVIVTGDVFLADSGRREEIRGALGATAIEMEGAAMVQVCRQFEVSCLVVRSITDSADTEASASYEQFIGLASENAAAVAMAAVDAFGRTAP